MPRFALSGRTALVTGGSSGIGRALTQLLLGEGVSRVLVVGRDHARLAAVEADLGEGVETLCCDLSDPEDLNRLLALLPTLAPELSLVFNNAGTQRLTDFTAADPLALLPSLRAEIAVNFTAAAAISIGLLPLLGRQQASAIVNITSGLALAPKASSPIYCATKAGMRSFTRAMRYQCEDRLPHVRIVEALPPLVNTAMTRGRGHGKISPERCAADILAGLKRGASEVHVGRSNLLRAIMRASPALGHRIMRNG